VAAGCSAGGGELQEKSALEHWISGGNSRDRLLKKIGHNCSSG
jgi:hypothetical protein